MRSSSGRPSAGSPLASLAPTPAPTPSGADWPKPVVVKTEASPPAAADANNAIGLLFRDLLGSPAMIAAANHHQRRRLEVSPTHPTAIEEARQSQKEPEKKGWGLAQILTLGLAGGDKDKDKEKAKEESAETLKRQVREYEQRLSDMRELASRQAQDISSLRSVAERTITDQAAAAGSRDEERWRQLMQEASMSQEQALAHGQRQLHELAASLQAAQRTAAQQQAAEWRHALQEASEAHAIVVSQLQEQLTQVCAEKKELMQQVRDARRASRESERKAAASAAMTMTVGGGEGGVRDVELAEEMSRVQREHAALESRHVELTNAHAREVEKATALRDQLAELRAETEAAVAAAVATEAAAWSRRVEEAEAAQRHSESQLAVMSARRRELVNRLQEANGAIRVLCRCRPLSPDEMARGEESRVTMPAHNALVVDDEGGARTDYTFDAVFGVHATQQALYEEISPAVSSVLAGQYVCVMAYGQTGAGKTHTMQGGRGELGLVQLAVAEVLREARTLADERAQKGDKLEVCASRSPQPMHAFGWPPPHHPTACLVLDRGGQVTRNRMTSQRRRGGTPVAD